jgi:outer membrane protein OmpA-like peptidoglycan-associated protein
MSWSYNFGKKYIFGAILFFIHISTINAQIVNKIDILPNFQSPISYPAISPDGKHLVFLSDGLIKQVYESFLVSGQWSNPTILSVIDGFKNKNPNPDIGGFSFNHDGSILYFHSNANGNDDIFWSRINNGQYTEPISFEAPINTPANEYSPSISADGKEFILLRDKPGNDPKDGLCKVLVLYEKDNVNNTWIGPRYLPTVLNSGCQETPFFCSDNATLLFATQRPDTNKFGKNVEDWGYNIYFTKNLFDNNWLVPSYVEELNTEFNDLSPIMDYAGDNFLTNIKAKKLKNKPQGIFKTPLPSNVKPEFSLLINGTITNLNTGKPIDAKIIVYNLVTQTVVGEYSTRDSGKYSIILKKDIDFKIDYYDQGYSHFYYYLNTFKLNSQQVKEVNVTLYDEVNLDLNVFDKELFYPLSPKITIIDSTTNQTAGVETKPVSKGRYSCSLKIGKKYKMHFENEHYEPYDEYFDLNTDVQYNAFEKDIEMQASKQIIILNVSDELGNDTLSVMVNVRNLTRNEKNSVLAKRDKDGNLIVELREGDRYEVDVAKKGYTYFNTKVDVNKKNTTKKLDIKLNTLTTKTKMVFNDITFETNSADINTTSNEELTRLVQFMNDNPDIYIEVSAHTDDKGSDAYNINLSMKRAQTVVDYLSRQSIDKNRLKSKGYGKSMPLVPNISEENRAKNRRVELKIIEKPQI